MLDVGSGPTLLVIPGIQGRWEWMQPTIDALAREFRVITASLPGEPGVDMPFDEGTDFDSFVQHIDGVLDAAGVPDAVICGVSFGGLIALRYAARRSHRVRGLILVSTPGPRWKLKPHLAWCARWPTLGSPLFALGAVRTRRGSPLLERAARDLSRAADTAQRVRCHVLARREGAGHPVPHESSSPRCREPGFRGRLRRRRGPHARRHR